MFAPRRNQTGGVCLLTTLVSPLCSPSLLYVECAIELQKLLFTISRYIHGERSGCGDQWMQRSQFSCYVCWECQYLTTIFFLYFSFIIFARNSSNNIAVLLPEDYYDHHTNLSTLKKYVLATVESARNCFVLLSSTLRFYHSLFSVVRTIDFWRLRCCGRRLAFSLLYCHFLFWCMFWA